MRRIVIVTMLIFSINVFAMSKPDPSLHKTSSRSVKDIFQTIRDHNFEKNSGYEGVPGNGDNAWKVRILAISDLVKTAPGDHAEVIAGLGDRNRHVRHVAVTALRLLGVKQAGPELLKLLVEDPDPIVRCEAAQALGQIGYDKAKGTLKKIASEDKNKNVAHRAKIALKRFGSKDQQGTAAALQAWKKLDESTFNKVEVGKPAPDFTLKDTNGKTWKLSDYKGKKNVALIWIFADWCWVCQGEFNDLSKLENKFKEHDIQVLTIECHDLHRSNEMVTGKEKALGKKFWWPHLIDNAGAVAAVYNVDPMEFTVHDEWINRPSTILVDKEGIVRFTYYGTFWGDRPTIHQTLNMIEYDHYEFEHPKRRK